MNQKKSMGILLCAMLVGAGILSGCGGNPEPQTSSAVSEPEVQSQVRVDLPENAEINKNMKISEGVYTKGNLTVKYPTVGDMDVPEATTNTVNTLIQQDWLRVMDQYAESEGTFEYQLMYNNGKILAIRYAGALTTKDAAHPTNVVFTTNINLETGERISSGAPEKAQEIAALLVSGEGYEVEGEEELQQAIITALKTMDPAVLSQSIAGADFGPDKQPTVFTSYAGEQKVTVSLPVEHALGDVAHIIIDWAPPSPEPAPAGSEVTSQAEPSAPIEADGSAGSSAIPAAASDATSAAESQV